MRIFFRPVLYGVAAYFLFFYGLGALGLVGPDEPRYADVARQMFLTGDYITPHLFGEPWFEKPPLYYWLAALSFRLGVNEFTARLPSALSGVLFLGLWYWFAARFYGEQAARWSCLILATSAGYIGFSHAAAMDMLLTTTLGAALVSYCLWEWEGSRFGLAGFYTLLAVATLAKGPLAVVLAGMVLLAQLIHSRDWDRPLRMIRHPTVLCFFAIAVPWYFLCYTANGYPFIQEFFIRHNLQRLTSGEVIGHSQPFWFYLPVLPAALFPWSPLLLLPLFALARQGIGDSLKSARVSLLFYWTLLPLLFFSLAENKLPGYLLPLLPPLSLWIATSIRPAGITPEDMAPEKETIAALQSAHTHRAWRPEKILLMIAASLLLLTPGIVLLIPGALSAGFRSSLAEISSTGFWNALSASPFPTQLWLALLALTALSFYLIWNGKLLPAASAITLTVIFCITSMLTYLSPAINRVASSRNVAARVKTLGFHPAQLATFYLHRNQIYGLSFYLNQPHVEWNPYTASQSISYVAARADLPVDELRLGARSLILFPGQNLRLWSFDRTDAPVNSEDSEMAFPRKQAN
jgi:4-amino-4-deoxy-L-arabinose transferase-like glycosyltransferase